MQTAWAYELVGGGAARVVQKKFLWAIAIFSGSSQQPEMKNNFVVFIKRKNTIIGWGGLDTAILDETLLSTI